MPEICERCGDKFEVEAGAESSEVYCPECEEILGLKESYNTLDLGSGTKLKCISCGREISNDRMIFWSVEGGSQCAPCAREEEAGMVRRERFEYLRDMLFVVVGGVALGGLLERFLFWVFLGD